MSEDIFAESAMSFDTNGSLTDWYQTWIYHGEWMITYLSIMKTNVHVWNLWCPFLSNSNHYTKHLNVEGKCFTCGDLVLCRMLFADWVMSPSHFRPDMKLTSSKRSLACIFLLWLFFNASPTSVHVNEIKSWDKLYISSAWQGSIFRVRFNLN